MRGGLQLSAKKQLPVARSIGIASIPKRITVALQSRDGNVETFVTRGAHVLFGQPLAHSHSGYVHAPVSGLLVAVERGANSCVVTIDGDGQDTPHSSVQPIPNPELLSAELLRERIALAGIAGLGGAGFSTAAKLNAAAKDRARLLIINGAECEPFIACDTALMREQAGEVLLGTKILLHASGAARAVIAIEGDKADAIAAITQALDLNRDEHIRLQIVRKQYPIGGEHQLVEAITSREIPSGGVPSDIGVLCQNVGTAVAVARLVKTGQPLTSRIVSITGHGVKEPRNLVARFGTSVASLIADCGGYTGQIERLIMGGSMMGVALKSDDIPVSVATNCIVAATAEDLAPRAAEMPCIRCGNCAEVCPAGLLPQQLLRFARSDDRAALNELGLRDCIECGCCDYVCPSQIPITEQLHRSKHMLALQRDTPTYQPGDYT